MNGPIRKLSGFVMLLFFALLANVTVSYVVRTDSLNANPQNRRVTDSQFAQDRGPILAGNTPIATTAPVQDRFQFQRSYPQGPLYAAATGYYSYLYGTSALEQSQSALLSGRSSSQWFQHMIDLATGAKSKGATVETTLDPRAQAAAAQALGKLEGAAVVLNYKTGAVLAMYSNPSYDPNSLASHDLTASKAAWEAALADPTKPLSNRAAKEIWAPGSTFKLIDSAAALEAGYRPETLVDAPTSLKVPGTTVTIDQNCGGTSIPLSQALAVSCNPAFANLGMKLGADALRTQAQKFGFGQKFLPEIGNSAASVFPATLDVPQTAQSAIGEFEVAATPLQMAMVAAGIANDGAVMTPYLVTDVRAPDLSVISSTTPKVASQAMSASNAKLLQQMMIGVVENGTGTRAQIPGVVIGGKTGTARTDASRNPYAWFVCWADDPSVAVAVFVQDAQIDATDIAGGRIAAPMARAIIQALR
ncbi:MAG: penicillin-binding protein 2 [Propionibacteriaceae bacterium]|nr:cell division protein FtsI [Propionibacteriaceae bacterium]